MNYFPKFAHPLFIQVTSHNGHAFLMWQKGKAIRGHVEQTTHMAFCDSGWVDETEDEYYVNDWPTGTLDSNARQLVFNIKKIIGHKTVGWQPTNATANIIEAIAMKYLFNFIRQHEFFFEYAKQNKSYYCGT